MADAPARPEPVPRESARRALAVTGEQAAADWYVERGYELVVRNWRCRDGEIDLIVRRGRQFVFCEVKARTTVAFGAPVEAVGRTKQVRLRRLAARWIQEAAPVRPTGVRFDVVSVLGGVVEVIEGAF